MIAADKPMDFTERTKTAYQLSDEQISALIRAKVANGEKCIIATERTDRQAAEKLRADTIALVPELKCSELKAGFGNPPKHYQYHFYP